MLHTPIDIATAVLAAASFRTILHLCPAAVVLGDTLPASGTQAQSNSGALNQKFFSGSVSFVGVRYSSQVVRGNPGDVAPILIATNLLSNTPAFCHAFGFAEAVVHTSFDDASAVVCTNASCSTKNTYFSGTFDWLTNWGKAGGVMQPEVEAHSGDSPISESANASADPFIFVDLSFAGVTNYSIEVSPCIGNGLAVAAPEPRTPGLMPAAPLILVRNVGLQDKVRHS